MTEENLATEILHELKKQTNRYFIMLIIAIILLFASNITWLIVWNNYKSVVESYDLNGQDNANVVYNSQWDVKINGENER